MSDNIQYEKDEPLSLRTRFHEVRRKIEKSGIEPKTLIENIRNWELYSAISELTSEGMGLLEACNVLCKDEKYSGEKPETLLARYEQEKARTHEIYEEYKTQSK